MQDEKITLIDKIVKFQLSDAYPVVFALLCALSGLSNKFIYLPIIFLLVASVLFSLMFVKDPKVLLVPIFMIYYSLGTDNKNTYSETRGDVFASIDSDAWVCIFIVAAIVVAAIIIRFSLDGTFKSAFRLRGMAFPGIIAIDAALLLNGAFSGNWVIEDLYFGILLATFLTVFYLVLCPIIRRADGKILTYACKIMTLTSYIVFIQMLFGLLRAQLNGELFYYHEYNQRWVLDRNLLSMSWGIPTVAGGVLILGIPSAFYLARNEKHPAIYYLSALLFTLMPILMNARSSIVVGAICFLCGACFVSFSGRNRKFNLIFSLSLFAVAVAAVSAVCLRLDRLGLLLRYAEELWLLSRFDITSDRLDLIRIGWQHFLEKPIFGIGVLCGAQVDGAVFNNAFADMYHNIIIQFAASMGVVGFSAFAFHIKDFALLGFNKPRVNRLLLLLVPAAILLLSLFDNFFFYPNFQILYAAFLILAEKELQITKDGLV